jgi:hypothetical protein
MRMRTLPDFQRWATVSVCLDSDPWIRAFYLNAWVRGDPSGGGHVCLTGIVYTLAAALRAPAGIRGVEIRISGLRPVQENIPKKSGDFPPKQLTNRRRVKVKLLFSAFFMCGLQAPAASLTRLTTVTPFIHCVCVLAFCAPGCRRLRTWRQHGRRAASPASSATESKMLSRWLLRQRAGLLVLRYFLKKSSCPFASPVRELLRREITEFLITEACCSPDGRGGSQTLFTFINLFRSSFGS